MNFLNKCSILTGVSTYDNHIFVTVMNDALANERRQHAIPLSLINDVWSLIFDDPVLPWIVAGMDGIEKPSAQIAIVGWGGQVLILDGNLCQREGITKTKSEHVSILRSVVNIDNTFYAVGMKRQVYKRAHKIGWTDIGRDVEYHGDEINVGFNAIGGFNCTEIYAVGLSGEIWSYDDNSWYQIQSPTNVHLFSVCCASDGNVYAGGKYGVLLRGRHDSWEVLNTNIEETIWHLHFFRGKLYLVSSDGVYLLNGNNLEKIKNDLLNYSDFIRITSSKDRMWIFGRKKIVQYDGLSWIECNTLLSDDVKLSQATVFFNDEVLVTGSDYLPD